jgi:hypothetical protein
MRQLELQDMPLPAMFQCCLFRMSLGPQFNVFTAVAAMATGDADFKLDRLMAKASDFQGRHDVDEACDGKAMWSEGGQALWLVRGSKQQKAPRRQRRIFW